MALRNLIVRSIIIAVLAAIRPGVGVACTSAIVSAEMNPYGRPLLWKNRDTNTIDNKVEYVPSKDGSHAYVALYNAKDRNLEEAWMGMNDVGFAVMNTASFNIKDDKVPAKMMDREGFLMTLALQTCKTVDDFERLLDEYPRPMGVEANFGVIDASGAGAFFETNNHSYVRYDLKDAPDGVLVRTNYSHSGRKGGGHGYNREANANHLLAPYIAGKAVTAEVLTEVLSRSFYHEQRGGRDFSTAQGLVLDDEFIPRHKSTATVVIEGCRPVADIDSVKPGDLTDEYVMWTVLGYPPLSEIVAVWCREDGVAPELRGIGPDGHSPMGDRVKASRDSVFTLKGKKKYIDMPRLQKRMKEIVRKNLETYGKVRGEMP